MKNFLLMSLLFFLSATYAKTIYPNSTLKKNDIKKLIIGNLKSEYPRLLTLGTTVRSLKYSIAKIEIDDITKNAFAMDIKITHEKLGIKCNVSLVKLITKNWYYAKGSCSSEPQSMDAGFYFKNDDGELENVLDDGQFLDDTKLCYKSTVTNALNIANTYADELFWVGDEYSVENISKQGEYIVVEVLDIFSFEDNSATPEEREDYTYYYKIGKCQE